MFLIEFESISDNVIYFLLKHSSFFFVFCHLDIIHYVMMFKDYHFSKHRLHDQRCVFLFPFVVKLKFKKKVKLQKTSSMKTRTWIVIDCKESVNNIMIRMKCAFVLKGYKTHNIDAICKTNIKKCITDSVITRNFLSVKFTRYERGMIKISIIFYIFSL